MKFEIEDVLRNCLLKVQEKLADQIAIVNGQRVDFAILDIPTDAYFFASMPKAAFNYRQFVVYGFLNDPQVESGQADNNIKVINLYFEVVSVDAGENPAENVVYQLMRYSTALEEVFLKNSAKIMQGYGNLQVSTLSPSSLFNVDGKMIRSAGVSVTARITAR